MLEILEYILVAMKALCIIAIMSLGFTGKGKRTRDGIIPAFSAAALVTAVYMLCRAWLKMTSPTSCDAVFTMMILIYGMICFEGGIRQKLIFLFGAALLALACMHGSNAVFFMYPGHSEFLHSGENTLNALAMLSVEINVQLVVIGIFVILWNRLYRRQKTVKYIYIYLIFPISQFVTIFFLNGVSAYKHLFGRTVSVLGLMIGYIADIVLYHMLMNHEYKKELQNRLEETKRVREIEKAHYDAVEAGRTEIDKLSREFDAQLAQIIDMVESGKKGEADIFFRQLKMDVAATRECQYCSNAVVNAVLTEKEKQAKTQSVDMEINLTVAQEITVSPMHLCSVFSNLLDNAIHAASVYDGQRLIRVNAGYAGDYFFVNVENGCDKPARRAVRKGHGYGLKILEDIARQYDGQFSHGWQNGIYTARLMLTARQREA